MKENSKGWLNLALWLGIMSVISGFAFFLREPEYVINMSKGVPGVGIKEYNPALFWFLKPFTFWDGVGFFLLSLAIFAITGAYKLFIGEQNLDKGPLMAASFGVVVLGLIGIILMFMA